jgi:type I restriction-modification system DNA methylase subunit
LALRHITITNTQKIEKAKSSFNDLVGYYNNDLKKILINSLSNGHSTEALGKHFELSLEQFERKNKGQYYTPRKIVEFILNQLNITKDSKILDPACGCGSFLLTAFDIFKERYNLNFLNNIYGVDINDKAVKMTQACLYMETGFNNEYIPLLKKNIKYGNSIVSNKLLDERAFIWCSEYHDVLQEGGFDFIIGNPPYITFRKKIDYDPTESIYPYIVNGSANAATLMIGRSLDLLKNDGILAFLLPKSILFVDSYRKLRKYLTENNVILQVFDLGSKFIDVRGEQCILFIQKRPPLKSKNKTRVRVFKKNNIDLTEQPSLLVDQSNFFELDRFLTFEKKDYYQVINKLSEINVKLKDFVEDNIFRGIPIGGNHVQIQNTKNNEGIKVIRGKNISKFKIRQPYIIDSNLLEKQSKAKINKLKNKKVVLQNIFSSESGIIAAYDTDNLLTLDTVTNILVYNDNKGKYLLGLLNSKLINFYLMYGIFDKSKLTMHMDKSYIGLVPIIDKTDDLKQTQLIKFIDSLIATDSIDMIKEKLKDIDKLVYEIYSLNKQEIVIVEEAVSEMLSGKSIW